MPYAYRHPDYPKEIHLNYPWIQEFVPTLYKLASSRLDKLLAFTKEEGLYWLPKAEVFPTVVQIALRQPERRR